MTTVAQLREALEEYDDEAEVRILHQPSYPLQEVLVGIHEPDGDHCGLEDCGVLDAGEVHDPMSPHFTHKFEARADAGVVFLVADGHPREGSPYGSKDAWEEMDRF